MGHPPSFRLLIRHFRSPSAQSLRCGADRFRSLRRHDGRTGGGLRFPACLCLLVPPPDPEPEAGQAACFALIRHQETASK